jgi:hypothetical protein
MKLNAKRKSTITLAKENGSNKKFCFGTKVIRARNSNANKLMPQLVTRRIAYNRINLNYEWFSGRFFGEP